ncbi:MAG: hypothetical protein NUV98_06775 [Candidatus Roizmanbacteria bacterium]|nr:hypothetical protein [Candidatus Roizmanbacteria bacterium]
MNAQLNTQSDELVSRLLEYAPEDSKNRLKGLLDTGTLLADDFIDKKMWKFLLHDQIREKIKQALPHEQPTQNPTRASQPSKNTPLSLRERYKDRYHFPFKVYKTLQMTNQSGDLNDKVNKLTQQVEYLKEKVRELSEKLDRQ